MASTAKTIYIVDGNRTPFIKAKGKPGNFSASDLAVYAARDMLARLPIQPEDIDEVVTGCMMPSEDEANVSRIVSLRLGCGKHTPAYTVQRNCASGMQALDNAYKDIKLGRRNLMLAGGCEAMSRAPLLFNQHMVNWFASWMRAKTMPQKLGMLAKVRPAMLAPVIAILRGLRDPIVGLSMGQTAEEVAFLFNITRKEMDEFALNSHKKLAHAMDEGYLDSIMSPVFDQKGGLYAFDDGLRRDSSLEKLSTLRPFFDKKYGSVTAANSSQVTDGASYLMLANEKAVEKHGLPVRAKIVDVEWSGVAPEVMGLAPAHAVPPLLKRNKMALKDVEYMEINEAFAAQVIGCLRAWESDEYSKKELGLSKAFGSFDTDKLNVDGGAVAIGHPVGASGARIVQHLLNVMERNDAERGVATICIGGGQGGAMLIERVKA
jgi:acetyl-CoA C-acetyltransferase